MDKRMGRWMHGLMHGWMDGDLKSEIRKSVFLIETKDHDVE